MRKGRNRCEKNKEKRRGGEERRLQQKKESKKLYLNLMCFERLLNDFGRIYC